MRGLWFAFLLFVLTGAVAVLVIWRFGMNPASQVLPGASSQERLFDDRNTVKLQAEMDGVKVDPNQKPSSLNLAPRISQTDSNSP